MFHHLQKPRWIIFALPETFRGHEREVLCGSCDPGSSRKVHSGVRLMSPVSRLRPMAQKSVSCCVYFLQWFDTRGWKAPTWSHSVFKSVPVGGLLRKAKNSMKKSGHNDFLLYISCQDTLIHQLNHTIVWTGGYVDIKTLCLHLKLSKLVKVTVTAQCTNRAFSQVGGGQVEAWFYQPFMEICILFHLSTLILNIKVNMKTIPVSEKLRLL